METKEEAGGKLKTEIYSSYDEIYKSITKEGSLGLLALGATGLKLWRKKRAEIESQEKSKENTSLQENQ